MKQSALVQHHSRAKASIGERHGWAVALRFSTPEDETAAARQKVGLADVSDLTKIDVSAPAPPEGDFDCWTLGRRHYLVMAPAEQRQQVVAALGDSAIDVTSVHAAFVLAGPKSRDTLRKLSSLNVSDKAMPNRSCRQAGLAHVHSTVIRKDIGDTPAFTILVARDYAEDVWESILHSGHEFGIARVGRDALVQVGA